MESPNGIQMSIDGGLGGYASSRRSSSETSMSGSSSSPTSTTYTSASELSAGRDIFAAGVVASPGTFVTVGESQYVSGEIRVMADTVAQARKTSELPPTQSSPLDSQVIIEDYTILAKLRLARGDPALPPPEEYTRLRVDAARRIRDRDAKLQDEECQQAVTERVEGYLRVVGQERRFYDLARARSQTTGGHGAGSEATNGTSDIMDEIVAVMEREVLDGSGGLRDNVGRIGTTAETLDLTASELDSTAGTLDSATRFLNTVASSLGGTATALNFATTNLDSTASTLNSTAGTLENTLGVMATQIGTLNTQLLALMNVLQPRLAQTQPNNLAPQHHTPIEDSVQESIEHAIREAIHRAQAPTPHGETPSPIMSSCPARASCSFPDISESTATKAPAKKRQHSEGKTRRPGRYMRIVINRILG